MWRFKLLGPIQNERIMIIFVSSTSCLLDNVPTDSKTDWDRLQTIWPLPTTNMAAWTCQQSRRPSAMWSCMYVALLWHTKQRITQHGTHILSLLTDVYGQAVSDSLRAPKWPQYTLIYDGCLILANVNMADWWRVVVCLCETKSPPYHQNCAVFYNVSIPPYSNA